MRRTVLLYFFFLVVTVKLVEGRGRIDLLAQLTNRRAGASLLGRIRPARPTSPREQARALQQGSDVNQLASSGNNAPPTKLNPTQRPGRQSLLERARSRPRRPFLPTKPTRAPFTPRRPSPRKSSPRASSSNRRPSAAAATDNLENSLRGGECDALKTENELLKQLIASVTSQKPRCCLSQTFPLDLQLAGWAEERGSERVPLHSVRYGFGSERALLSTPFVTVLDQRGPPWHSVRHGFVSKRAPLGTSSFTVLDQRGPPWHSVCYGFGSERAP